MPEPRALAKIMEVIRMIKFNREVNTKELQEVLILAQNQDTTDKYISTELDINGDYAHIQVSIDEFGDITVL